MLEPAPIYQSLTRPLQVAGAERNYAIMVIGATALLGVLGWYFHSSPCAIAAFLIYTSGMIFLRRASKKDPHMIEIAQRFYGYKKFYPARSTPSNNNGSQMRAFIAIVLGFFFLIVAWLFGILLLLIPAAILVGLGFFLIRSAR